MPSVRGGRDPVTAHRSAWFLERRLGVAVAVSLGIHAVAMSLSLPAPRAVLLDPRPALDVSFRELPLAAALPEPAALVPAAPPPANRARPLFRKHEAAPLLRKSEAPVPSPAPIAEATPIQTPGAEARVAPPAPLWQPPPVTVLAPVPRVSSAELLASYGQAISEALARYKVYPPVAQMQGWQGAVTMQLRVAPSGRLIDARVHASSGYEVLDRQALAMASKAERFPAPPEGLGEGEIAVLVPVVFRLEQR